ncbi:MAG: glutamate--tRNA ligase family protein [Gemmatimonadales bacterium]
MTRFAPSPTGYLHLGHVANALFVWGTARALGGRVLLRLEDHDRGRCRPEHEAAILEDPEWLGLEPDAGEPASFRAGPSPYRQSDCGAEYEAALARLSRSAEVYHCDCSRKDIAAEADPFNNEARYRGHCRRRGLAAGPGRGTRVWLEPGAERFLDLFLGEQAQDPADQCGDLLLRDRLGNWTYQFSVVVDDLRQGIDLVIRGRDLLDSTGRQIRLARLLGRERPPVYLHHPLIHRPDGAKLSKAGNDTGIRELRRAGITPASVLGQAAFRTGLLERPTAVDPRDLAGLFSGPSFPA